MLVVRCVTRHASRRQFDATRYGRAMTALAGNVAMLSRQRERRLLAVIEGPTGPNHRIVAGRAIGAEPPNVHVVICVARDARGLHIQKGRTLVAVLAFHARMLSKERKIGLAVIETNIGFPGCLSMALPAPIAQLAFVWIVVTMTTDAVGRWRLHMRRLFMTCRTGSGRMPAIQRKARIPLVLKTNLCPASLRVAVLADRAE